MSISETKINNIEKSIKALEMNIKSLETLLGNSVSLSQMKLSEKRMKEFISSNTAAITLIEERLSTIILPTETRYYLEESEVKDFRNNFQKLAAMISDIQELYDSMVAYVTNLERQTS